MLTVVYSEKKFFCFTGHVGPKRDNDYLSPLLFMAFLYVVHYLDFTSK